MSEIINERRQEDRRVSDLCLHERDWLRLEQRVDRHDEELKTLIGDSVGTKVYMKQIIDSQEEVKASIKELQTELQKRNTSSDRANKEQDSWSDIARRMAPDVIKVVFVLVIIIAVLIGADNIVTKAIGGTP